MTTSTDAILAYGFDLGEDRPEFLDGYEDFEDFIVEQARLIMPETDDYKDPAWKAYWQAKREAVAAYPIELITHCSCEYPMYFLAVRGTEIQASRGTPVRLEMNLPPTKEQLRAMQTFCEQRGIEWQMPGWHLFSYWN